MRNSEKRRRIIELRKEGCTIREIAIQTHSSSRTVVDVLKDESLKEALEESRRIEQEQRNVLQTTYTKALRLFKDKKSLLEVTIELGVSAEETKKAFLDFWEMSNLDDFRGIYKDIKPFLPVLLTVWNNVKEKGLFAKGVVVAMEHAIDRGKAEEELQAITDKVTNMQTQVTRLNSDLMAQENVRPDAIESRDKDTSFIDKLLKSQRDENSTMTRMK